MTLQWFETQITRGHVGAGKGLDETVYIQAPHIIAAMEIAAQFPGAKKSRKCGNSLRPVDEPPRGANKWYWRK